MFFIGLIPFKIRANSWLFKVATWIIYESISSKIVIILNASLKPKMHRDEVLESINNIAAVKIVESNQLDNGLLRELTEIQICPNYRDNIKLIIDYQNGDEFIEFVHFLDD